MRATRVPLKRKSSLDDRINTLLREYGFRLAGDTLINCGIRGFTSDSVMRGRYDSPLEAAEWLIPLVADDEYYNRLVAIRNSNND